MVFGKEYMVYSAVEKESRWILFLTGVRGHVNDQMISENFCPIGEIIKVSCDKK